MVRESKPERGCKCLDSCASPPLDWHFPRQCDSCCSHSTLKTWKSSTVDNLFHENNRFFGDTMAINIQTPRFLKSFFSGWIIPRRIWHRPQHCSPIHRDSLTPFFLQINVTTPIICMFLFLCQNSCCICTPPSLSEFLKRTQKFAMTWKYWISSGGFGYLPLIKPNKFNQW